MGQVGIQCMYFNHNQCFIERVCLNLGCQNSNRKVCEVCLTEKHSNHEQDCLKFEHLKIILENEVRKIVLFQEILKDQQDVCETNLNKIKKGQKIISQQKCHKLDYLIQLSMKCYNQLIYDEIIHQIYCKTTFKEIILHFNSVYEQEDVDFLKNLFLYKGDNLLIISKIQKIRQAGKGIQALEYYDKAFNITTGQDNKLFVMKQKYELLYSQVYQKTYRYIAKIFILEIQNYGEASRTLIQINQMQMNLNTYNQKALQFYNKYLGLLEMLPQFDLFGGLTQKIFKNISNQIIFQGSLIVKLSIAINIIYSNYKSIFDTHNYYEAFHKLREIPRSDIAFGLSIELQGSFSSEISAYVILNNNFSLIQQELNVLDKHQILFAKNQNKIRIINHLFSGNALKFMQQKQSEPDNDGHFQIIQYFQCIFQSFTLKSLIIYSSLARCECYDQALREIQKAIEIYPNHIFALFIQKLLQIHFVKGTKDSFQSLQLTQTDQESQKVLIASILQSDYFLSLYVYRKIQINPQGYLSQQKSLQNNQMTTIIIKDWLELKNGRAQQLFDLLKCI